MGLTAGDILHFQLEGTRSLAPLKNEGSYHLISFSQILVTTRKVPSDLPRHSPREASRLPATCRGQALCMGSALCRSHTPASAPLNDDECLLPTQSCLTLCNPVDSNP